MNLTDDEVLKFQKGTPVLLEDICAIYPVTLGEIVDLGYEKFQQYLGVITATKPDGQMMDDKEFNLLMDNLTDFQYVLMISALDPQVNRMMKEAFQFFTHEEVTFSLEPAQIIIGPSEDRHLLSEENFYDLQKILRRMYFLEQEGEEIIIHEDDDPAVKKLKKQMRANREKVRRAKAKQAAKEAQCRAEKQIANEEVLSLLAL